MQEPLQVGVLFHGIERLAKLTLGALAQHLAGEDEGGTHLVHQIPSLPKHKNSAVEAGVHPRAIAILRLEESDFHRHYLHDLVSTWPDVDELCLKVFEDLRQRVRYTAQLPADEPIIVFSPHPDDDVISMGGMLDKLTKNGNQITVAYMTNGSVAVFDADVRRYLHFLEISQPVFDDDSSDKAAADMRLALDDKAPGAIDTAEVQRVKAFIRYAEAVSAIEVMGLRSDNARRIL